MRFAAVLLVTFACSGAFASDPGQPLDCSDWVMVKPGITCHTVLPSPCLNAAYRIGIENARRRIDRVVADCVPKLFIGITIGIATDDWVFGRS